MIFCKIVPSELMEGRIRHSEWRISAYYPSGGWGNPPKVLQLATSLHSGLEVGFFTEDFRKKD
jgi:hypothetical protein